MAKLTKSNRLKTKEDSNQGLCQCVSQKLVDNIKSGRSCNYSDVKLILDNEQTCVEPLHLLNKVVDDARKRVIYFSCLEGQVLKRLI